MKLSLLFLLPLASIAFNPEASRVINQQRGGELTLKSDLGDAAEKVVSTTEEYVGKADDLLLNRAMRVVDHAPAFFTLKALADAGGISASLSGITSNPGAFTGLGTALSVPTASFNVWTAICAFQTLSLAKSALATDGNELSQADITATAAANWVATRAIGSASPLRDTILTAIVSGYAVRNGSAGGDATIHSTSLQLMSSFTTVLSVLGLVDGIAAKVPIISGNSNLVSLLGIASYYVMITREGNGLAKKAVNAGILGGMLVNALKGGVTFSLTVGSLLTNVVLLGIAYLAYEGINSLRNAVFD
ncbi:hypothetical protein ACHAXR_005188 [Thalassiosira sp. AJA248-18]